MPTIRTRTVARSDATVLHAEARRRRIRARAALIAGAIVALLLGLAPTLRAAEPACSDDFSADRPGFSTDPGVLVHGCQQLEWGYQFSRDENGGSVSNQTLPLLLYRIGIGNALELRAGWDGINFTRTDGLASHSANDPTLGVKLRLHDGDGLKLSLLTQITLPLGSAAATSGGVDPSAALLWSRNLSERTTLSGAFTLASISNPGAVRVLRSALAVDLGRDFGHGFGGFIEYAGNDQNGVGFAQTLDGGLTWLIGGKLQLDVNAGIGLNSRAQAGFVGFGAAWRF